ncbi:MAG: hypothetical protein GKR94_31815 [Gammaproteobacteria bacterium]|nr:hypothetical protein [Gammaproteobacteria bacterium]
MTIVSGAQLDEFGQSAKRWRLRLAQSFGTHAPSVMMPNVVPSSNSP